MAINDITGAVVVDWWTCFLCALRDLRGSRAVDQIRNSIRITRNDLMKPESFRW